MISYVNENTLNVIFKIEHTITQNLKTFFY